MHKRLFPSFCRNLVIAFGSRFFFEILTDLCQNALQEEDSFLKSYKYTLSKYIHNSDWTV